MLSHSAGGKAREFTPPPDLSSSTAPLVEGKAEKNVFHTFAETFQLFHYKIEV